MKQTVSSILILLLLVSQSVFAVPHSHAGSSIVEPDGHASRPHFHLYGYTHHSHRDNDHNSPSSTSQQDSDHDSTAVYTGDEQLFHDSHRVRIADIDLFVEWSVVDSFQTTAASATWSHRCWNHGLTIAPRSHCALYLQFLSIRC